MGREVTEWDVTSKKSVIFIFRIWDLADVDDNFSFLAAINSFGYKKKMESKK